MADLKHEQELDEMQQNQPQPEFSQDHIVRRLISKFRKPSDAGTIGLPSTGASSNTLQVPAATHGGGPASVPTISGLLSDSAGTSGSTQAEPGPAPAATGLHGSLATKQSRWSQLVASAAAGAASKSGSSASHGPAASSSRSGDLAGPSSSTRALLDIQRPDGAESSSNRSSADGRDDEVDENYFRPGGKGHQALLDNMDKR